MKPERAPIFLTLEERATIVAALAFYADRGFSYKGAARPIPPYDNVASDTNRFAALPPSAVRNLGKAIILGALDSAP